MAARCNVCKSIDVYRCSVCNNFGCYTRSCDGSIYSHPGTCSQCNSEISIWDNTMIRVNKSPFSWSRNKSDDDKPIDPVEMFMSLWILGTIIYMFIAYT